MVAFTYHDIQSDRTGSTSVPIAPIFLDSTREEKILTIFRLITLIVHGYGTINYHDSEKSLGSYRNDKIILYSETGGKHCIPYGSQKVSVANVDGKVIFEAYYLINKNVVSSPTLIIYTNHLDPLFDDNAPDLPNHYREVTHALYELWRHLLETHPAARTPAYDYTPALIPSEFF